MSMGPENLPAKGSALFYQARGKFVAQADEIRPQYLDPDSVSGTAIFNAGITRDVGPTLGSTIDAVDFESMSTVGQFGELATPWYSDQILPFDITLAAQNEYGAQAGARILGVEILNEGTGVSIDDTVTETRSPARRRTKNTRARARGRPVGPALLLPLPAVSSRPGSHAQLMHGQLAFRPVSYLRFHGQVKVRGK